VNESVISVDMGGARNTNMGTFKHDNKHGRGWEVFQVNGHMYA